MRRPSWPHDDNRDNVYEHCNDNNSNNYDDHRGAVETNTGESDGANCYLELFDNTTIWYVVAAMVEWPMGSELIFVGDLNVYLERTSEQWLDEEIAVAVTTVGLEDIYAHLLTQ